jgi:hypothetical protein
MDSHEVFSFIAAGVILGWFAPSLLVGLRAQREGFALGAFILISLFLSWPLALAIASALGKRSPLVTALERQVDVALLD